MLQKQDGLLFSTSIDSALEHECEAKPSLRSLYLKEVNDTQDIEPFPSTPILGSIFKYKDEERVEITLNPTLCCGLCYLCDPHHKPLKLVLAYTSSHSVLHSCSELTTLSSLVCAKLLCSFVYSLYPRSHSHFTASTHRQHV